MFMLGVESVQFNAQPAGAQSMGIMHTRKNGHVYSQEHKSHPKGGEGVCNSRIFEWYYPNINCAVAWNKNVLIQTFLEAGQKPHIYRSCDCSGALYVWIVHELKLLRCPLGSSCAPDTAPYG